MNKTPALQLQNVSVQRGDTLILHDINWTLPAGSSAVILGPNGSGKTTLIRLLSGYEWPTTGTVDVLEHRLGQVDVRKIRREIAVVDPAQRFGVDLNLTAHQVVLTGCFATLWLYDKPTKQQIEHADHLLKTVGMSHRRDHRFGLLSTGEQRRCLLGRAMIHIPKMLILDEPTAGLDVAGREHLLATIDLLRKRPDAPTILMITHHVEEISSLTDQVLVLAEGRIIAHGSPDSVITPETLSGALGCKVFVQKRAGRFWLEVLPEAWLDLLRS